MAIKFAATFRDGVKLLDEAFRHFTIVLEVELRLLNVTVLPVFVSPKLEQQLKRHKIKPPIVNQQCIVYEFKCNLCDAGYVGYTRGHLHERVEGHTRKSSSIYKHYNLQPQ